MDFIRQAEKPREFENLWAAYIKRNPASVRYALDKLAYQKAYAPALAADLSFVAVEGQEAVGIAFLPLEKTAAGLSISLAGYTPAPLCANAKAEKQIYAEIETVARRNGAAQVKFFLDSSVGAPRYNLLVKYGYLDTTGSNGLIDLRRKSLREGIRKGHWYDIQRMLKNPDLSLEIIDHTRPDAAAHREYQRLHHLCSGRVTRPQETFDRQFDLLKKDNAILVGLKHRQAWIGFGFYLHLQKAALYFSAADDPEYADHQRLPVYHPIMWVAMEYYQKRGFNTIEVSPPCAYSSQWDEPVDDKQRNIASFKRGFGTEMVPFFRGTLYLNEAAFAADIERFRKEYSTVIARRAAPVQE